MNGGRLLGTKGTSNGSGWLLTETPVKSWAWRLGRGMQPPPASCGRRCHLSTGNARWRTATFGRRMPRCCRGSGIVRVGKTAGKPTIVNGSTPPCANASAAWYAKPCPSRRIVRIIVALSGISSITILRPWRGAVPLPFGDYQILYPARDYTLLYNCIAYDSWLEGRARHKIYMTGPR